MNISSTLKVGLSTDIKEIPKRIRKVLFLIFKRTFDLVGSIVGLIILFPVFIIITILIKREDKGRAIFTQERIGKNGKIFKLYKFRSMVSNADDILAEMLKDPKIAKEYKKNMKLPNDPRITKIGSLIRKTSLDELPQLINVFLGNMSLIGNRPYLPREKKDMSIYYEEIIKTKPGITGYWQVSGRSNISFKERCKLESFYSNNMNFKLDVKIFFLTFYVVITKKGAE